MNRVSLGCCGCTRHHHFCFCPQTWWTGQTASTTPSCFGGSQSRSWICRSWRTWVWWTVSRPGAPQEKTHPHRGARRRRSVGAGGVTARLWHHGGILDPRQQRPVWPVCLSLCRTSCLSSLPLPSGELLSPTSTLCWPISTCCSEAPWRDVMTLDLWPCTRPSLLCPVSVPPVHARRRLSVSWMFFGFECTPVAMVSRGWSQMKCWRCIRPFLWHPLFLWKQGPFCSLINDLVFIDY